MKKSNALIFVFALFFLLTFTGCPNAVVQTPKFSTEESISVSTPQNFTVSNGLKGKINFSWDAYNGAKKYYIYSSDDEFSGFTKCYETKDTSFSFTGMPAGVDKYYYVVAVIGNNGTLSSASEVKRGTTLASPVLNAIEPGEDEVNDAVVYWYMNNVEAYADDVEYTVYYYETLTGGGAKGSKTSSGEDTYVTFTGLGSYQSYYYYVVAHNKNDDADVFEDSGTRLNYRTAAETTPQPVTIKEYTQGNNGRNISISFELPEMVRIAQEGNALYPLKFQISRRIASESNWYVVDTFVGETNEITGKLGFYEQIDQGEEESNYIPGSVVTWTDSYKDSLGRDVTTGKKYYYAIKSYADYTSTITSSKSTAYLGDSNDIDTAAYLFVSPNVSVERHDGSLSGGTYTSYTTKFAFNNNKSGNLDLTSGYDIYIGYKCTPTDSTKDESYAYKKLAASDEENGSTKWTQNGTWSYSHTFNLDESSGDEVATEGNYKFYAFIVMAVIKVSDGTSFEDLESATGVLGAVPISGTYLVYKDSTTIPSVENFSVTKGYYGKITINFDAKANLTYALSYEVNGVEKQVQIGGDNATSGFSTESTFSTGSEMESDINSVAIVHTVSDFTADYTVTVTNTAGVSLSKTLSGSTLYTPSFSFTPGYKDIKIAFAGVTNASSYSLSGKYPGGGDINITDITSGSASSNASLEYDSTEDIYTYTLDDETGLAYSDMLKAGSPFYLTLTANSTIELESAYATNAINSLGPAAIELQNQTAKSNSIVVQWNTVEGATGYVVYRFMYNTTSITSSNCTSLSSIKNTDKFFVLLSNKTCSVKNADGDSEENVLCSYAESSDGDSIIFEDKVYTGSDTATKEGQTRISWGYPYGYVVFPVGETSADNAFAVVDFAEGDSLAMETGKSVYYSNFADAYATLSTNKVSTISSTNGYGLNLKATKAESATAITLAWDAPYNTTDNTKTYIFYRTKYEHNVSGDIQQIASPSWNVLATWDGVGITSYTADYTQFLNYLDLPVEFLVTFGGKYSTAVASIMDSYSTYLEETLEVTDEDADGYRYIYANALDAEPQNVGYFCTLPGFVADYAGTTSTTSSDSKYFMEKVEWNSWNTTYRKLVPSSFSIAIKNKNVASTCDWTGLAATVTGNSTSSAGTFEEYGTAQSTGNVKATGVATTSGGSANFTPVNLSYTPNNESTAWKGDGYYDGYLKVQRDYKHYYGISFNLTHIADVESTTVQEYGTIPSGSTFIVDPTYGYRNITVEEQIKNLSLIIADALTQAGVKENEHRYCYGAVGYFYTHTGSAGNHDSDWGTKGNNYQHIFRSGASSGDTTELTSAYVINMPNQVSGASVSGQKVYHFGGQSKDETGHNWATVISHESGLNSYTLLININVGKSYRYPKHRLRINLGTNGLASYDAGNTIWVGNDWTNQNTWFPFELQTSHESTTSTYNSSYSVYSSSLGWWN